MRRQPSVEIVIWSDGRVQHMAATRSGSRSRSRDLAAGADNVGDLAKAMQLAMENFGVARKSDLDGIKEELGEVKEKQIEQDSRITKLEEALESMRKLLQDQRVAVGGDCAGGATSL